jgi:hypothetical protein
MHADTHSKLLLQIASAGNEVSIEPLLQLLGFRNQDSEVLSSDPAQTPSVTSPGSLTVLSDYNESPRERVVVELRILKFPDLIDSRFSVSAASIEH